ncbi:MAG TPA: class I tRNA ligase family protein, partial [Promineifilum sp.]|nr:class I tRNA ligase family protein [Promineifilum sp.]
DEGFATVAELYNDCKFRAAVQEVLRLSTLVNQYLEETSPWTTVKTDPAAAGRALYVALQAINGLKIMWAPVLPFTSQTLHELLGETGTLFGEQLIRQYDEATRSHLALTYDGTTAVGRWERTPIPVGRHLPKPRPLFRKLEPELAEQEIARLGPKPELQ